MPCIDMLEADIHPVKSLLQLWVKFIAPAQRVVQWMSTDDKRYREWSGKSLR